MNEIKFIIPNEKYKSQFYEMRKESKFNKEDVSLYGVDDIKKYDQLKNYPEYVPASFYWIINSEVDKLIGVITIRHGLKDADDRNGHIFLIIRPSERKKGYGLLATKFAIDKCKELNINNPVIETQLENSRAINLLLNCDCYKIDEYTEYGYKKVTYKAK